MAECHCLFPVRGDSSGVCEVQHAHTHTHTCAGLHSEKTSCCLPTCLAILSQILGLQHYIAQADTGRSVHPPPYHSFVASGRYGGPDAPALQITLSTLMAYNAWSLELHKHTPPKRGSDMRALFSTVRLGSRNFFDHTLFWSLSLCFQRREIIEQFAEQVMGLTLFLKQFSHGFNHFE